MKKISSLGRPIFLTALFLCSLWLPSAFAVVKTWTGGTSTDWHTATNWSPSGVPTAADDVKIPNVTNDPVIGAAAVAKTVHVQASGSLVINTSASLTVNGSYSVTGDMNPKAMRNNGTVSNSGILRIGSTTASGNYGLINNGIFENNFGGEVIIDRSTEAGLSNSIGATFINTSKVTIGATVGVGQYGLLNSGTFNNKTGSEMAIDRSTKYGLYNSRSDFTNAGKITIGAVAGVGATAVYNESPDATFSNTGSACSGEGLLRIVSNAVITNNGTFSNSGIIIESGTGNSKISSNSGVVQNLNGGTFTIGSNTGTLTTVEGSISPTFTAFPASPVSYNVGTAIATNSATVSGLAPITWSVSPALPAGLSLNTTTGVITGTPTAAAAAASYNVTATNTCGSTTVAVNITVSQVSQAPSSLTYSSNPATYCTPLRPIAPNSPSILGTPPFTYAVSPALPQGLSLNTKTGVIAGTPKATPAPANYTVTATNAYGSTTVAVNITVMTNVPDVLTYSGNPVTYYVGKAITTNLAKLSFGMPPPFNHTPSTYNPITYSVSPALPTGLSLNTTTGAIMGTPTATAAAAPYTVTATNACSSTKVTVNITVVPRKALLSFSKIDDGVVVWLNDEKVFEYGEYDNSKFGGKNKDTDITVKMKTGANSLTVIATNQMAYSNLRGYLEIDGEKKVLLQSDSGTGSTRGEFYKKTFSIDW